MTFGLVGSQKGSEHHAHRAVEDPDYLYGFYSSIQTSKKFYGCFGYIINGDKIGIGKGLVRSHVCLLSKGFEYSGDTRPHQGVNSLFSSCLVVGFLKFSPLCVGADKIKLSTLNKYTYLICLGIFATDNSLQVR